MGSTHKLRRYSSAACSTASDESVCSDSWRKGGAWLSLISFLFVALTAGTTASAAERHGEAATSALDRGNHVFLFEGFPSVDNSWGSLQVNSVAGLKGHDARRSTMLRATFTSTTSEQLELVASAAEEGDVFLVASTKRSEWSMRWKQESQPALYGLIEPRDPSHIEAIISHGINVEELPRYFKPAIHPDDFGVVMDFLAFQSQLPYSHPEFSIGEDWELLAEMEWLRLCQLSLDHLPDENGRAFIEDAAILSSMACFGSALAAAGSSLQLWQQSVACATCLATRAPSICSTCASQLGIAVGSLTLAIVTCFEDDELAPDDPPPPQPPQPPAPPGGGGAPAPIPGPGGGLLVPIYQEITTTVCVDGVCWTETQIIVLGWQYIHLP